MEIERALVVTARRARAIDVPFALAVVVTLLISPHVLIHDLTLLLVIPTEDGLARASRRAGGAGDRMERSELAFHQRVARAFEHFASDDWQRAHPECGPIVTVDAIGTEAAVVRLNLNLVLSNMNTLGLMAELDIQSFGHPSRQLAVTTRKQHISAR